jgi:hypothetical protein
LVEARTYVDFLYPPASRPDGYVSVWSLPSKVSEHFQISDSNLPTRIAALDAAGQNVFLGLGLRNHNPGPSARGSKKDICALPGFWLDIDIRGPGHVAENLPASLAEVVEGILKPFEFEPTAVVDSGGGLHVYWLTEHPILITDANRAEVAKLSKLWQERLISLASNALGEGRGWHVDQTADLARVLRPVGTSNRKGAPTREPRPVQFLTPPEKGVRYDYETLKRFLTVKPSPLSALLAEQAAPGPADPATADAPLTSETPRLSPPRAQDEVLGNLRRLIKNNKKPERAEIYKAILAGKGFAQKGERDHTLQRVGSWLGFLEPEAPPEVVAEILRPSLEAMEAESPDDFLTIDHAIDKIARAQGDARRIYEQNRASEARMKDFAFREARKKFEPYTAPVTPVSVAPVSAYTPPVGAADKPSVALSLLSPLKSPAEAGGGLDRSAGVVPPVHLASPASGSGEAIPSRSLALALVSSASDTPILPAAPIARPPEGPAEAYTYEELAAWAEEQSALSKYRIDPLALRSRLVIQNGEAFYVMVNGRYEKAIQRGELDQSIVRDLRCVPSRIVLPSAEEHEFFTWTTFKADGSVRKKTIKEALQEICQVARGGTVIDLSLPTSFYDPVAQIFYEAPCPVRDLEPRFDPNVQTWLELLGGAEKEKLLDWIATITDLQYPSAGLFLSGAPSTGKSMLGDGLARLWTTGKPTKMDDASGHFNADIVKCPLVIADEYLPKDTNGKPLSTAKLRDMIASVARPIRRKFQETADMRGAIRAMFCSNTEDFLNTADEVLGPDGVKAVAGRFLHIGLNEEPARFLADIGGRWKGTADWVSGDLIARHALYLRGTRKVIPGERFIVEGRMTKMHDLLSTQGTIPGLVVEWLARFLDNPRKANRALHNHSVLCGGGPPGEGRLLVNAPGMLASWGDYIEGYPPTLHRVSEALASMSKSSTKVREERGGKNRRYWDLRVEMVLRWADDHQVGDPEDLRVKVFSSELTLASLK